jgi:hypothetical protein
VGDADVTSTANGKTVLYINNIIACYLSIFDQSVRFSKFPASWVHVPTAAFDKGASDACTEVGSARIADGN